jgi:UDP-N-acetylmuramoyl-L-alanyl-D-glutamate--2,6-diaminopimelate ligase
VLEVSSHALAQERASGLSFAAAAFTNLTRDHLDYHRDMERYFAAKARLFEEHLAPSGTAIVNVDDPFGARLARSLETRGVGLWRQGTAEGCDLRALRVRQSVRGIAATVATPAGGLEVTSPLIGSHNVENLLTAAGLALASGLTPSAVEKGLSASLGAPGRLERIEGRGVLAFVDYAHTPDALARALAALRSLEPPRVVLVFGCGGDRDRGKRPLMGEVAGRGADLVLATSDNPRSEDPLAILAEIVPGLEQAGCRRLDHAAAARGEAGYLVLPDRREAIHTALELARPGELVLIAGKGHEDYEIVGTEKRPFDDRVEARRALGVTP